MPKEDYIVENVIILNLLVKKLKRRKSDLNEFQMRNYNEIALRIKSFGGETGSGQGQVGG